MSLLFIKVLSIGLLNIYKQSCYIEISCFNIIKQEIIEENIMGEKKENWKEFGKDTGKAFKSFGKAIGKTAQVAFTDKDNTIEENGKSELGNAWTETGKGFSKSGKDFGKAMARTFKPVEKEDEKKEETEVADEVVDN